MWKYKWYPNEVSLHNPSAKRWLQHLALKEESTQNWYRLKPQTSKGMTSWLPPPPSLFVRLSCQRELYKVVIVLRSDSSVIIVNFLPCNKLCFQRNSTETRQFTKPHSSTLISWRHLLWKSRREAVPSTPTTANTKHFLLQSCTIATSNNTWHLNLDFFMQNALTFACGHRRAWCNADCTVLLYLLLFPSKGIGDAHFHLHVFIADFY